MRFLFVDQITSMDATTIGGVKYFEQHEPWRFERPDGQHRIASGVVSEAIGQLVSWLCLAKNDFRARPVFLFANEIRISDFVSPDTPVKLQGEITRLDDEMLIFSGRASMGDQELVSISDCGGYFMPLEQLEDPEVTRDRFSKLTRGLLRDPSPYPAYGLDQLIDRIGDRKIGESVVAVKQMRHDEPYYKDHFPRFPVTPIVVINEMIGRVAAHLYEPKQVRELRPVSVQDLKIKSFVKPGDICETRVNVRERSGDEVETIAEVFVKGKRILRGRYRYQLMGVEA